ncbi:response regulator [Pirellula sp. SH-Sr6A]|uniref:response regulator n=1 Tax=Pirellula sp. SH-Sr6A TaxID=1632865 RepID=UPI001438B847|nr:response regulator [Pirellula sp. SH-Sr6A]
MRTGCVILADPHLGMLGGVHRLLESSFQTLVMVSDERSLTEAIEKIQPSLLVVDLSLSNSGEANIIQRLHSAHPNIPLVVLSVHDEPSVASVACASGAAGFVIKQNIGTELLPVVKSILRVEACNSSTKVDDV